jgi:hypothetical protein
VGDSTSGESGERGAGSLIWRCWMDAKAAARGVGFAT